MIQLSYRESKGAVPVLIIGGFLGAGKTTLLNHILSENHGVRAAVLVNDFGAINIDAKLVVGVTGETINLANGCVCCSIRDDLVSACLDLLRRPERPELVIIETSGVSDPVQIARTFQMPELRNLLMLDNILAVVDAAGFPSLTGDAALLANVQIKAASMVVLNKIDLVTAEQRKALHARIRESSPGARLLDASHGRVPLELVLGPSAREPAAVSPHSDAHQPAHRHSFTTWHWSSDQPLSLARLRWVFESLPEEVYRAKGVLCLEELPSYRIILQMVGTQSSIRESGRWGNETPRSEIVVIATRGALDSDVLRQRFDACIGGREDAPSPLLQLSRKLGIGNAGLCGQASAAINHE